MKYNSLFALTIIGLLFSGYLGGIKLFSDTCAFNETCSLFLGFPTCYYGFAMYFILFILLLIAKINRTAELRMLYSMIGVSFVGILFSGYFSIIEITKVMWGNGWEYFLLLPTCAYGLVLFFAIFGTTYRVIKQVQNEVVS